MVQRLRSQIEKHRNRIECYRGSEKRYTECLRYLEILSRRVEILECLWRLIESEIISDCPPPMRLIPENDDLSLVRLEY